jgi:hypothetical protein
MKQVKVFKSKVLILIVVALSNCITICQSIFFVFLSASVLLTGCSPGTTNNNTYQTSNSGMSGGGSTKDPGDGTGGSTGDGGGGQGVECRDSKNPIVHNKLFVRDIYEAQINRHLTMMSIPNYSGNKNQVSDLAIKMLVQALRDYYGPSSYNLEFVREKFWKEFASKISFLNDEKKLYPSQDANSPITLLEGCKIVQIAYWEESSDPSGPGTLYVNQKLWSELDELNKIGLLAHEFFYKQARKALAKNSDSTRSYIGELLSEGHLKPLFANWKSAADPKLMGVLPETSKGYKFCVGTAKDDEDAKLHLYQYLGDDKSDHFVVPYIVSNSINLNYFQNASVSIKPYNGPWYLRPIIHDFAQFPPKMVEYLNTPVTVPTLEWAVDWYQDEWPLIPMYDQHSFNTVVEEISRASEVLWSARIKSAHPIKISYLNPVPKNQIKRTLKSGPELKRLTIEKMSEQIKICTQRNSGLRFDSEVLKLNKRILEGNVKFQSDYLNDEEWQSYVESTKFEIAEVVPRDVSCVKNLRHKLLFLFPRILYKIEAQTYSSSDFEGILGDIAFNGDRLKSMPNQVVQVAQGDSILDFNLSCENYSAMYGKIMAHSIDSTKVANHKNITIKVAPASGAKQAIDDSELKVGSLGQILVSQFAKKARYESNLNHEALKVLLSSLSKVASESARDLFYDSGTNKLNLSKDEIAIYRKITSNHNQMFVNDFKGEESIELSVCDTRSSNSPCAIVKMVSHNRTYKVKYTVSGSESDPVFESIFFAKLLSNKGDE